MGDVVASLIAVEGDLEGDAFVLRSGENHLGRGSDCSPLLNSRWISRSHAVLTCRDGEMQIRASEGKDLWVNDARVDGQVLLEDGDRIRLGTTVLSLRTVAVGEPALGAADPVAADTPGTRSPGEVAARAELAQPKGAAVASPPPLLRPKKRSWRFWTRSVPALVFVRGQRMGERIELTSPRIRIGGLEENEIVISGNEASRNHAELRVRGGRVHIWDLRSVNGTWVNDKRIENTQLRFGDVIRIGSEELRYED